MGQQFVHPWSRTVTEMDNTLFSLLTMNPQPLHLDAHFAEQTEWGQRLFNSLYTLGILVGMNSWNGFLWPLIVLRTQSKLTLPLGLASLLTPYGNNYEVLIAGSVFAIIPILALFLAFQKYFIEGMTAGGVKG